MTLKHKEKITDLLTLELHGDCHKARVCLGDKLLFGLSTSLKYYYDTSGKGFVSQKERTKKECVVLAKSWLETLNLEIDKDE